MANTDFPFFERAHLNEWVSPSANPLGDINRMAEHSRAKYLEMTTVGADMPPLLPEVEELFRRQADADYAAREDAARAAVVAKVREVIEYAVDNGQYGGALGHLGGEGFQAIADAAVEVFLGMLKNPPAFVTHPDGHTEIEWPESS